MADHAQCQQRRIGSSNNNVIISTSGTSNTRQNTGADFECPEEFGYYPHKTDCTKYYVCVFGGALLESCTGGLQYSHELQTCDWPRNVGCESANAEVIDTTTQRQSSQQQNNNIQQLSRVRFGTQQNYNNNQQSQIIVNNNQQNQQFIADQQDVSRPNPLLVNNGDYVSNSGVNLRLSPKPVVTSRGEPRRLAIQESLAKLYSDAESDDLTNNRNRHNNHDDDSGDDDDDELDDVIQRVYRGQPSTVGQVQRDRDGLVLHTNALPTQGKIGSFSFGTQVQQPIQQYRVEQNQYNTAQDSSKRTQNNQRTVTYNNNRNNSTNSRNYATPFDPYYSLSVYDEDVEIYKDQDYSPRPAVVQQTYRTPAPSQSLNIQSHHSSTTLKSVSYDNSANSNYNINTNNQKPSYDNRQVYKNDYDEIDDQSYRQPIKTQTSENAPVKSAVEEKEVEIPEDDLIDQEESIEDDIKVQDKNIEIQDKNEAAQQSTAKTRTRTRGRGNAHYTTGDLIETSITPNNNNINRGTPPNRGSRPTLKPSTSIIAQAQQFVDIYRYPPSRPPAIYPVPTPDKPAAKCRADVCLIPDCSCGGKDIPGNISAKETPQIVLLTFDDAINDLNSAIYEDLFEKGRKNPNGCPITATFYVSHEWTDYSQVQNLYADGHEMASHTISHSFGEQFSQRKWAREVAGQREILAAYGGVRLEDVRGMRAPFLSVGGNKMYKMLYDQNFTYDSSMPVYENRPPSWPYTLDYKIFHDCMIPPCPTRSYPGVWEVPMVMWQDLNGGRCSMGDACSNPPTSEGVVKVLRKNFERHYTTNRAPFGLFYHAAWFTQPHHKEGFIQFLDELIQMPDVYLVTNWQALQWIRDPTPLSRMHDFEPFKCDYSNRPKRCNNPKVCNLWHKSGVRYMRTCQPCPDIYPWTGKTGIRSSRIDNDIED
ncbi:uncharacterized protein LOC113383720 [Ctenocephalides felis]|uniref:uncharacterized protein LOC113383720 n=1 Tax=Ctenocephalides felis TaxID=7515 RepID=UPI000E6E2065|nr:uncharacterized protein LOC113383720 [Ctenocephalides felis]